MIIEKLPLTKGEKVAEIVSGELTIGSVVGYVVLMSTGVISGVAVIMIVLSLIWYTAFTICSLFPQHTNIAMNPEKCSEKRLRSIRRGCIAANIIFVALMFATQLY